MAHPAQQEFCHEVKLRFPQLFQDTRVLEVGSRNINGSVRDEFLNSDYIEIDVEAGPGGLFFKTCADEGRKEHGTTRTGTRYVPDANFDQNVSLPLFLSWIQETIFEELYIKHNREASDLYCYAIKAQ